MKLESGNCDRNCLTLENINQNVLSIEYAVRGPVVRRAAELETELIKGVKKPFERVVRANVGDMHALGQKPVTFIRQVLSAVANPALLDSSELPQDVKQRAAELLRDCTNHSVGSYSPVSGLPVVRRRVAEHLAARDGTPASPDDIYLGSGASDLIKAVLTLFAEKVDGKPPSVMIPCPQYPLFSATLAELGIARAYYYLDEGRGWALREDELARSYRAASAGTAVRAIVVINPGNPTGQVLTRQNIEEIIKFAYNHDLFILADEVYQQNIVSKPFFSFKKVMQEMGAPYSGMELGSFLTLSKGWAAECGLRAGCAELRWGPAVGGAFATARAVLQCPNVLGQCALDCVMKPPAPGDPSYPLFAQEMQDIRQLLSDRCRDAYEALNSIPGISCNLIDGSMFAYPKIEMPQKAQEAAKKLKMSPDELYVLDLLEETGVCMVPGSGFGQLPGTFHLRTTILHERGEFLHMMDCLRTFHRNFLLKYS